MRSEAATTHELMKSTVVDRADSIEGGLSGQLSTFRQTLNATGPTEC